MDSSVHAKHIMEHQLVELFLVLMACLVLLLLVTVHVYIIGQHQFMVTQLTHAAQEYGLVVVVDANVPHRGDIVRFQEQVDGVA
tara:strand:- start:511 stop:762 length:252 start_codon:yes stop_codon:yes gene_type:complete